MRFSVLGRLKVVGDDGAELRIAQPRQRALLAVLLLHANEEISASRLTELLWDSGSTAVAPGSLRTQIWALRKLLGPAQRLHTGAYRGYRLEVRQDELDVVRFRQLAGKGRDALKSGDLPDAARLLSQARDLWGEPPLADVPATLAMGPVAQRLLDERAVARELLNQARLGLGEHAQLIPELRESTAANPANERLWEQLMLALPGAGRSADALAAYQQARASMQAELGLEPGHRLQELHRRILAGDLQPRRDEAAGADEQRQQITTRDPALVPRQLPAPVLPFVGREAELAELTGLLERADAPSATVIASICGTAGVGKTALAVHWAHQVGDRFPDGQLYANLRGFDPSGNPTPTVAAIRALLDALEVPAERIPASLDAQVGLYRSIVAGKRVLLVLDNARNAEQVRPLLPGGAGCLVLVTSRTDMGGLTAIEGAHSLLLSLLTDADARALLVARLGAARLDAEPGAAGELVRLCARLPLALVIAAARVAARPGFRLRTLADELADTRNRLDALDTGDELASLRAVFSWSVGSLPAPTARMFGLLGLHPGPDIAVPAAASLAGVPIAQARACLDELAGVSLTTEHAPGRFSVHDLLRAYAAEQARVSGSESGNSEATGRMLDHYLHTAYSAARLINPQRETISLPSPRPRVTPEYLAGHQHALTWLESEHEVLISAIRTADEAGLDSHAWQLPWAMANFLDWHGFWDEWVATQHTALAAVTRLGDAAAQAVTRRLLGQACARLGDYEQARAHLTECIGLYRQSGDQDGEARVHQTLSWLSGLQGSFDSALGHTEQALTLYRVSGNRAGQALALNNSGYARISLGDPQQGRANCRQALDIYEELGNLNGQANTWHSIGFAEYRLGEPARAVESYRRALGLYQELGRRQNAAGTLADIGDALDVAGDPKEARDAWQQALDILDDLRHPDAARVREKLRQPGHSAAGPPQAFTIRG